MTHAAFIPPDDSLEQALSELADADLPLLKARWQEVFGREAPATLRAGMMARAMAYRLQAAALGDVSLGERHVRTSAKAAARSGEGVKLLRTWRGAVHEVQVTATGFVYAGRAYRSLSAIAREITGVRWNGLTFFGGQGPGRAVEGHAMTGQPQPLRCAVYTRKSSEEGLEQAFNSLHAQREACEAYIKSQQHEGWVLDPTAYDDGAYSGGNMNRPGLQALLAQVKAGQVDVVVVYKVDRLTRSLPDFARIVDVLDAAKASFVSVTQAFNTTTSMGRLTLNVLLSFAQFEREVTGERIRDKIAASKAKGMWMGGVPPLGYDVKDRALVVNPAEAEVVRRLFGLYVASRSVDRVIEAAAAEGLVSKTRITSAGPVGGTAFTRGALYTLLANPAYVGEVAHKGQRHLGQHQAIVEREVFDEVQTILAANRHARKLGRNAPHPSLLPGLLRGPDGRVFTATHSQKKGRRYRYYALAASEAQPALRLPAEALETVVRDALGDWLGSADRVLSIADIASGEAIGRALAEAQRLRAALRDGDDRDRRKIAAALLARVDYGHNRLTLTIKADAFGGLAGMTTDWIVRSELARRGVDLKLVVDNGRADPDPTLLSALATGAAWFDDLVTGRVASLSEIARREGCTDTYVIRLVEASFLCPELKSAVMRGRQPVALTLERLRERTPLPLDWRGHARHLGLAEEGL